MNHVAILEDLYEISLQNNEQQAAYLEAYISSRLLEDQVHLLLYLKFSHEWILKSIRLGRYEEKLNGETGKDVDNSIQNLEMLMKDYVPTRLLAAQAQLAKDLQLERELGLSLNVASHAALAGQQVPGPTEKATISVENEYVTRAEIQKMLGRKERRVDQLRKKPWFPKQVYIIPRSVHYRRSEILKMLEGKDFAEWKQNEAAKDFDNKDPEEWLAKRKEPKRPANLSKPKQR
jgi:predicted DNA-binding transcriptional regulator AlpA